MAVKSKQNKTAKSLDAAADGNSVSASKDEVKSTETAKEVNGNAENENPNEILDGNCRLDEEQVSKAVAVAFQAYKISEEKSGDGNLFEQDPDPVLLLVSCIKMNDGEPKPFRVALPNPALHKESEICLIVKDLEKGWKVNHEPTVQHYTELLEGKGINSVNEVIPLRQLRVDYKPFEARGKLCKRFDVFLVDLRVAKFIPRYLGKAFYQSGKLPISVNLEEQNLPKEFDRALSFSLMSMTNKGNSSQICVGSSDQEEKQVVENIMATYRAMVRKFPGKFQNVRSLSLRLGNHDWSVPIYVSYATRESITMPKTNKDEAPLIEDLSTLPAGMKVAVYKSGLVEVVKDEEYKRTALDGPEKSNKKKNKKKKPAAKSETVKVAAQKKQKKKKLDEDDEDISDLDDEDDDDEDLSDIEDAGDVSDGADQEPASVVKPKASKAVPKKAAAAADDDSSDDGDELEDKYMEELAMLEEEQSTTNSGNQVVADAQAPAKKAKLKRTLPAKKNISVKKQKKVK